MESCCLKKLLIHFTVGAVINFIGLLKAMDSVPIKIDDSHIAERLTMPKIISNGKMTITAKILKKS